LGILDWLFKKKRFERFEDTFALNRDRLWKAVYECIVAPQNSGKSIWLVVHFMETYSELQSLLDEWSVDYNVQSKRLNVRELEQAGLLKPDSVSLILADLIPEVTTQNLALENDDANRIAFIVVDRHPLFSRDQRIESFARSLPTLVEFGYYLALDDAVVKLVLSDTALTVLKQLGLNEHQLIASNLVSRRLNVALKRMEAEYASTDDADSATQWLEINSRPIIA